METIKVKINIDLLRPGGVQMISAQRGDTARSLEVRLYQGTRAYPLTPDCYAAFTARKPDGAVLCNDCEILDGAVIYRFTSQTTSCAGGLEAQIRIYGADRSLITTAPIRIEVYDSVADPEEAGPVKDEMTALDALVSRTSEVCTALEQKLESGDFRGESAYETARRLGFTGTEQQWTDSLRYDHSEEFTALAEQVRQNRTDAQAAAVQASGAAEAARTEADRAAENAAQSRNLIDDKAVSREKTHSSRKLQEDLKNMLGSMIALTCPQFRISGPSAVCHPAAGYPFTELRSRIFPRQSGRGDPGPDNVRPFLPVGSAELTLEAGGEKQCYTAQLPPDTYGGEVDWKRKKLIPTWKTVVFNGSPEEGWFDAGGGAPFSAELKNYRVQTNNDRPPFIVCPELKTIPYNDDWTTQTDFISQNPDPVIIRIHSSKAADLKTWRKNLSVHPLTIMYMADIPEETIPISTSGTPAGLPGPNTVYSSTGDTEVSGRADPKMVIEEIQQRLTALENQAVYEV